MNRDQLQDAYITEIIDGMDIKSMEAMLYDLLDKEMCKMDEFELRDEVEQFYPHLID